MTTPGGYLYVPQPAKPPDQRRRRNKPEQWTILPASGCPKPAPDWPLSKTTALEVQLWAEVWALPIAWWWYEQQISPFVIARYVRAYRQAVNSPKGNPDSSALTTMEKALGLNLDGLKNLRLIVEEDEQIEQRMENANQGKWDHLRVVDLGA